MGMVLIERRKVNVTSKGSYFLVLPKTWIRAYYPDTPRHLEVLVAFGKYVVVMPENTPFEEVMRVKAFLEREGTKEPYR